MQYLKLTKEQRAIKRWRQRYAHQISTLKFNNPFMTQQEADALARAKLPPMPGKQPKPRKKKHSRTKNRG